MLLLPLWAVRPVQSLSACTRGALYPFYFYVKTCIGFFIISPSFIFRMRNVLDKSLRENQNTHFVFSNPPPRKILPFMRRCGNTLQSGAGHRWQYGACALHAGYLRLQIHTHTHTHTHVVLLIAFPQQHWLSERASVLRYTYISCLISVWGMKVDQQMIFGK